MFLSSCGIFTSCDSVFLWLEKKRCAYQSFEIPIDISCVADYLSNSTSASLLDSMQVFSHRFVKYPILDKLIRRLDDPGLAVSLHNSFGRHSNLSNVSISSYILNSRI